ncbi:MAG TPA: ATP-binding cassette domain-containing protein [Gemmatimonadales bacterium]|jgi:ABC-type transporter Mla maintaining outer membrane lipid asymmetry ATPase subunit MlaF
MNEPPILFEAVAIPGIPDGGFSLEVAALSTTLIQAPEASGVDLLSRYALGLVRPASGRVLLLGKDVAALPRRAALAFRRNVGYLPAGDGLMQNLSLRDNVALPLRFGSRMSEGDIAGRVSVILGQFRLAGAGDRRPADVTDEMRRRTALARALAFDPPVVLMEDPFDGLTTRASTELLTIARGGESDDGSRRTVFITGQQVPSVVERRIEWRFRLHRGELEHDA